MRMDEVLSDVDNANSINSFPQGAEKPIIRRVKSGGMGSVVFLGISAKVDSLNNADLTDLANKVESDLLNTKTITQITKNGFPEKEININVRENDLLKYGILFKKFLLLLQKILISLQVE